MTVCDGDRSEDHLSQAHCGDVPAETQRPRSDFQAEKADSSRPPAPVHSTSCPFALAVSETLQRRGLLEQADTVVVACSGGPDSVALALVLAELRDAWRFEVQLAHCNHRLRGADSDRDEEYTACLAKDLGIPFLLRRLEVGGGRGRGNLEARLRVARYDFLAGVAAQCGGAVATGHSLNDQAETLLMKLLRGAGPGGLSGVAARRLHRDPGSGVLVPVVRPLLEVGRPAILDYLAAKGQHYCQDHTNADRDFARNWVRHELIPGLADRLNPKVCLALARTAEVMADVDRYLEGVADCQLARILGPGSRQAGSSVRVPFHELEEADLAVRRQMIRRLLNIVRGGLEGITLHHVEAILALRKKSSGRRIDLPGGISAWNEFGVLRLAVRGRIAPFCVALPVPGEVVLPEPAKRVVASVAGSAAGMVRELQLQLTVRSRRSGDRLCPGPGQPERRLKRLFNEFRIPISERDELVVLEHGGRIVGVEGITVPRGEPIILPEGIVVEIETFRPVRYSK